LQKYGAVPASEVSAKIEAAADGKRKRQKRSTVVDGPYKILAQFVQYYLQGQTTIIDQLCEELAEIVDAAGDEEVEEDEED
jgi:hypothetical protein